MRSTLPLLNVGDLRSLMVTLGIVKLLNLLLGHSLDPESLRYNELSIVGIFSPSTQIIL